MLVTINTDASFNLKAKIGTYAFWAVCNDWKICKYGSFKGEVLDSTEAEMKCIINALFMVLTQPGMKRISRIIINTDSLISVNAYHGWNGLGYKAKNRWKPLIKCLRKVIMDYRPDMLNRVELRHVKAHEGTDTARQWVNDWCDKHAKKAMNESLIRISA